MFSYLEFEEMKLKEEIKKMFYVTLTYSWSFIGDLYMNCEEQVPNFYWKEIVPYLIIKRIRRRENGCYKARRESEEI